MITYSQSETRVLDFVKKHPGATIQELVEDGHARSTVRLALMKAHAQGDVKVLFEWPRRYTWVDRKPVEPEPVREILKPDYVDPSEFGPRFKAGKTNIAKALQAINPERHDRDRVLAELGAVGRAVLGLYVALSQIEDGPEWRKEAGL